VTARWRAAALLLWAAPALADGPRPTKTLEECIAIALERQPTLGSSEAATDAGRARVRQNVSGYLPQVDGFWSTTRTKHATGSGGAPTVGGFAVASTSSKPFTFNNTGFSLSQVLFDFGKNLDQIRASQARVRSLEADEQTQRQTVVLNVRQSYFNLLADQRLLEVAEQTVRDSQSQLDQAQGRYRVGFAPRLDVTRSQVQLANSQLDRLTAANNVAVAEETLANAIGSEGPLDFDVVDVLDARVSVPSERDALAQAFDQRPDLRSLQEQRAAREKDVASLQKQYLPSVNGSANYNWSGQDFPLQEGWTFGATVNLSFSNGGLTTAQIAEAKADVRGLRFDEEKLRQDIALQVRQAVLDLRVSVERIDVSERAAQQARENLDLAQGRYREGVGNVIELNDAETTRASAEADRVRALYTVQTSLATLENATGKPIPKP